MPDMQVGLVLFPQVTQLDLTAPLQVFARIPGVVTHVVAKSEAPVETDCGVSFVPTCTYGSCPALDLVCVPGGPGVLGAIYDDATVAFVKERGGAARYVTSVCTGAFVLGVAGLLAGRRATTHWAYTHLLPLVGARHERARIVQDGNVITAGGVTAGLDFALSVAAEIAGETSAKAIQLALEYDPAPPFDCGHPGGAPSNVKAILESRYSQSTEALRAAIETVTAR
ncbi:MAG: glutamine amidotransferase [Candidatus Binatia bacterium]|nr:MAG: glutamine amidotransferase [Candidatus Binatia bacterium]